MITRVRTTSGRTSRHPTIKDQLDLVRTTQVLILRQNLLEENPPGQGTIEDLGKRKFGLQHGHNICITGLVIFVALAEVMTLCSQLVSMKTCLRSGRHWRNCYSRLCSAMLLRPVVLRLAEAGRRFAATRQPMVNRYQGRVHIRSESIGLYKN